MGKYAECFVHMYDYKNKYIYRNYGIIVDYFEWKIVNKDFLEILKYMSEEKGRSGYVEGYFFANCCDEEDIESGDYFEDGVMFYINDDEVIVDYQTYYNCLKLACDIYLEKYPEDFTYVEEKLSIIRNRYNIVVN